MPGKYGGGIILPINGAIEVLFDAGGCFRQFSTCSNGLTFSVWIKAFSYQSSLPRFFISSSMIVDLKTYSNQPEGFRFFFIMHDSVTHYESNSSSIMAYDQWHNVVITYSTNTKFEIYINGCANTLFIEAFPGVPQWDGADVEIQFGCLGTSQCIHAIFDDLRIWNEKKDKYFLWYLYNNKTQIV